MVGQRIVVDGDAHGLADARLGRPAFWRTITRAPVSVLQITCVSAPSSSTMITVAAIEPSGLSRSDSGRTPSTTSGPLPRTWSATAAGSGTEAPGKATQSVPRPPPPSASAVPLSTSIPSTRFMPGLPRKWATKALAGRA